MSKYYHVSDVFGKWIASIFHHGKGLIFILWKSWEAPLPPPLSDVPTPIVVIFEFRIWIIKPTTYIYWIKLFIALIRILVIMYNPFCYGAFWITAIMSLTLPLPLTLTITCYSTCIFIDFFNSSLQYTVVNW